MIITDNSTQGECAMKNVRKIEGPPIPEALKPYFAKYEQGSLTDEGLSEFLRRWLGQNEVAVAVREKLEKVRTELNRDVEARTMCKVETGIGAAPPLQGKKFV